MKPTKEKKCAVCTKKFTPRYTTTERTCSWQCEKFRQAEKQKERERPKRKTLSPVSEKRMKQLAEYRDKRPEFLKEKRCPVTGGAATEVHHMDGREGERLLDFSKCIAVSRDGHRWIHEHPAEAREKGWLV